MVVVGDSWHVSDQSDEQCEEMARIGKINQKNIGYSRLFPRNYRELLLRYLKEVSRCYVLLRLLYFYYYFFL